MLDKQTAMAFDNHVCDGFIRPTLAWCFTSPNHANENLGSGLFTNFWIGAPKDVKAFAEKMAQFYKEHCADPDNFDAKLDDHESVSIAYWEKDDIAMCAEIYNSHELYDVLPEEFFEEAKDTFNLRHVLFNGNDNGPTQFLQNDEGLLSVEELISFAAFMRYEDTVEICGDDYRDDYLPDFSDDDIERLKSAFQK